MKLKKCAALLLVSSCLLTGCTTSSAKKVDSKYVVASLEKGNKTKHIKMPLYIRTMCSGFFGYWLNCCNVPLSFRIIFFSRREI